LQNAPPKCGLNLDGNLLFTIIWVYNFNRFWK